MIKSQSSRCRCPTDGNKAWQLGVRSDRNKEDVMAEAWAQWSGDVYVCVGGLAVALMVGGEETGLCKGNE